MYKDETKLTFIDILIAMSPLLLFFGLTCFEIESSKSENKVEKVKVVNDTLKIDNRKYKIIEIK